MPFVDLATDHLVLGLVGVTTITSTFRGKYGKGAGQVLGKLHVGLELLNLGRTLSDLESL